MTYPEHPGTWPGDQPEPVTTSTTLPGPDAGSARTARRLAGVAAAVLLLAAGGATAAWAGGGGSDDPAQTYGVVTTEDPSGSTASDIADGAVADDRDCPEKSGGGSVSPAPDGASPSPSTPSPAPEESTL